MSTRLPIVTDAQLASALTALRDAIKGGAPDTADTLAEVLALALGASGLGLDWTPNTAMRQRELRVNAGLLYRRKAAGTSRASFDSTELAAFDQIGGTTTTTGPAGLDAEAVRDAIAAALVGTGLIAVTPNDPADTIVVSTTATANATDEQLRNRATHTGQQSVTTLSDFVEAWQDRLGSDLVAGSGVTLSYDDAGTGRVTITAATTGGGTTDPEIVRDVIGAALVAGNGVQITVNDAGDSVTIAALPVAAGGVPVTPVGSVSSTNVQAAIAELDSDVRALAGTSGGTSATRIYLDGPLKSTLTVGQSCLDAPVRLSDGGTIHLFEVRSAAALTGGTAVLGLTRNGTIVTTVTLASGSSVARIDPSATGDVVFAEGSLLDIVLVSKSATNSPQLAATIDSSATAPATAQAGTYVDEFSRTSTTTAGADWTVHGGVWATNGSALYCADGSDNAYLTYDTGKVNQHVRLVLDALATAEYPALVMSYVDNGNCYFLQVNPDGTAQLKKIVAYSTSDLGSAFAYTAGVDELDLGRTVSAGTITVGKVGAALQTITGETSFGTSTLAGVRHGASAGGNAARYGRFTSL